MDTFSQRYWNFFTLASIHYGNLHGSAKTHCQPLRRSYCLRLLRQSKFAKYKFEFVVCLFVQMLTFMVIERTNWIHISRTTSNEFKMLHRYIADKSISHCATHQIASWISKSNEPTKRCQFSEEKFQSALSRVGFSVSRIASAATEPIMIIVVFIKFIRYYCERAIS